MSFMQKLKHYIQLLRTDKDTYKPSYKLIEILKEEDDYVVVIQLIGKNIVFNAKPEEILAKDHLVDRFSPRDIRILTYLGYLGINAPKYKILAKKLSQDQKAFFWIQKKGEKKVIIKTAEEIIHETEIIESLNPNDAKTVGYTAAAESVLAEKQDKEDLLKQHQLNKAKTN